MTNDRTRADAGPDLGSAAVTGLTTIAWYAVPDVVGPRWCRALAKVAVLAAGVGAGVALTQEGRAARDGLRAALRTPQEDAGADDRASDANTLSAADDAAGASISPALLGVAVVGAVGVGTAISVAGEKWAYRRGERWRAKGLTLPHTRVGLIVGTLAAGLTLLEPPRAVEDVDRPVAPGASGAGRPRR